MPGARYQTTQVWRKGDLVISTGAFFWVAAAAADANVGPLTPGVTAVEAAGVGPWVSFGAPAEAIGSPVGGLVGVFMEEPKDAKAPEPRLKAVLGDARVLKEPPALNGPTALSGSRRALPSLLAAPPLPLPEPNPRADCGPLFSPLPSVLDNGRESFPGVGRRFHSVELIGSG